MGLQSINTLQGKALANESEGLGYSQYASLTSEEVEALTRIDAIVINRYFGLGHGNLSTRRLRDMDRQIREIKSSDEWISAVEKLKNLPIVGERFRSRK